jgi:hypothetical protein
MKSAWLSIMTWWSRSMRRADPLQPEREAVVELVGTAPGQPGLHGIGEDGRFGGAGLGRQRLQLLADVLVEIELLAAFGLVGHSMPPLEFRQNVAAWIVLRLAFVRSVGAAGGAATARPVHGLGVGGSVGPVVEAETDRVLGGVRFGETLFVQAGMALR